MRRKKGGNSLIIVIIMCMFVVTISAAMLSMVAGNYKARVVESKRVENLYSSDSGLDVAYNIIAKTFDAATKYANLKVNNLKSLTKDSGDGTSIYSKEYISLKGELYEWQHKNDNISDPTQKVSQKEINENITRINEACENIINQEFKRTFKNFILPDSNTKGKNEDLPSNSLRDYIRMHEFVSKVVENSDGNYDYELTTIKFSQDDPPELWIPEIGQENPDGSKETTDGLVLDSSGEKYKIIVKSNFKTSKENSNVIGENSRILQTIYEMTVPSYGDVFYKEKSGDLHQYLAINDRALTIHGDMNVNESDNLTVHGNIFVEGMDPAPATIIDNRTFEKYHGGIMIADSKEVKFTEDVVTRNTFNVRDSGDATISGNLYGGNVYVGGKYYPNDVNRGLDEYASNSTLDVSKGRVVLDNDLAMKANNNSTITIKDFYGINDKNISYEDLARGISFTRPSGDKVKSSSSIIVNGNDSTTKINITNLAYIMGTAHINTIGDNEGYQTGESGAVKGNYIAYSVPINEAEKFDYYDPLQLLVDSNVFNKAEHFQKYWDPEVKKTDEKPDTGGISWPHNDDGSINENNIHAIGAIVYKVGNQSPKVIKSGYDPNLELKNGDVEGPIYSARADFAKEVYKFGQERNIEDYNNSNKISCDSLMDLTKITSDNYDGLDKQVEKGEYAIFNPNDPSQDKKAKPIKIMKSDEDKDRINIVGDTIEINVAKKGSEGYKLNAVIATDGDVYIGEGIAINGSIIAKGDLNINGRGVTITYDPDVIDRIQAQNYVSFQEAFGEYTLDKSTGISNSVDQNSEITNNITYDIKKFLQNKLWKIIK